MRITNDDYKPSLDPESLEHYGIKGMKWGVRRTDDQLTRARGGKVGNAIKKSAKQQVDFYKPAARVATSGAKKVGGAAKKSAKQQVEFYTKPAGKAADAVRKRNENKMPTKSQSKRIKEARAELGPLRKNEFKNAEGIKAKASIAFLGELSKEHSLEYRANPNRVTAYKRTSGEKVANLLLSLPTIGTSLIYEAAGKWTLDRVREDQAKASIELMEKNGEMDKFLEDLMKLEKMSESEFQKHLVDIGEEEG